MAKKKSATSVKKAPAKKALKARKSKSVKKKSSKTVVGHEEQLVGKLRAAKDTKTFFKLLSESPDENRQLILSWAAVAEHVRSTKAQDLEPVLMEFLEYAFRNVGVPANTVPTLAHAEEEIQVQRDDQGDENPDTPWSLEELEEIEGFLADLIGEHDSDHPLAIFVELQ